jgi:hypothetical protein
VPQRGYRKVPVGVSSVVNALNTERMLTPSARASLSIVSKDGSRVPRSSALIIERDTPDKSRSSSRVNFARILNFIIRDIAGVLCHSR